TAGCLRFATPLLEEPLPGMAYELLANQEAPLLAIRRALGLGLEDSLPPLDVRLGTTRGTNALITRRGARTAFVTTRGFGDVLAIGYQNRPKLFQLAIEKPAPLYAAVVEIDARLAADGSVLRAPDDAEVRRQLAGLRDSGIQSLAVCLLHADRQPCHEQFVGRIAAELGFREISLSSRVAPLVKIVPRGDTTVVDAYLTPVLRDYVEAIRAQLGGGSRVRMLTSAGGLVAADDFVGKDSILSGPAGGVVGLARAAAAAGIEHAIGFDMGGTSTDVSRFDGHFEYQYETEKAGVRIVAPMMAIETVAAGGGSICRFDGIKLVVGPESAGADPGPACYGRGGPLAVTDVNLHLGRIVPQHFPFPLDRNVVQQRLAAVAAEVKAASGRTMSLDEVAEGFVRVANANMAAAIRSISVAKGVDPRGYTLVAFGGAAGQHACAVAEELGIQRILSHPDAGLLSAYGIGLADVTRHAVAGIDRPLSDMSLGELKEIFARLTDEARRGVLAEGISETQIEAICRLDVRYQGTDAALTIPWTDTTNVQAVFEAAHRRLYGFIVPRRELTLLAARVEAIGRTAESVQASVSVARTEATVNSVSPLYCGAVKHQATVYDRSRLTPGNMLRGPAIVVVAMATTVVDPGWEAVVLSGGELLIRHSLATQVTPGRRDLLAEPDPVLLEIFNNRFAGIAERMGITLRNTALSVNIKERLDFSCAIFTAEGNLVVNAPHIPVHLGAMSHTVRHLLAENPLLRPGDVLLTNDPFAGGSHLPDVTVVTPVHDGAGERVLFFTACRAHHAEIGGSEPGSMPPGSQSLTEEGVLLRNFKLVAAGEPRFDALAEVLRTAEYPSRAVADNLADVQAQAAANRQGAAELESLIAREGLDVVTAYMQHIQAAAEKKMRAALARLPDGRREFVDYLELPPPIGSSITPQSVPIAVAITIAGDEAVFDFTGTAPVVPGNLNATPAIVSAAVMYVLRCLIDEEIPLNEGVMTPVRIVLPECLLNPPRHSDPRRCAAVVGGNVETSQRVVDVLLGALGIAAASQGTMNNLLFGDESFGYYETICGGAGATHNRDGADAVHTHMTNTRLTDAEVLERRYPVRLLEFSIHRGSGGSGQWRGGDGVVRRIEFLRRLTVSILSQRRGPHPPYGFHGGEPGQLGRNRLLRRDGSMHELPGQVRLSVEPGDILIIETPGGGGWGLS
ncbi:MAG: hydantoinase B/oxoprolinase family protein, partial [Planctomycetia bacterium]|nr:hydantoinase B/oxoprolinase family protein [Planctomycetia bacterium]